jgi:hypothetical protein
MVYDWDDHHPKNDAMPWMLRLKEINPAFKATLFAVPGLGTDEFWDSHPDWIELAVHGWLHPDPYECAEWSYERTVQAIETKPKAFVTGWKSPGWQISNATYEALLDRDWWVADQHLEDHRRPVKLRTYLYEDGNWHGHVQDVCGNGLRETWGEVVERVSSTEVFEFASAAAR